MDKIPKVYEDFAGIAKEHGCKPVPGRKLTPKQIRESWIEFYQNYKPEVPCISCYRKELEQLERDRQYNLRAYQIMTDREILMTQQRERDLQRQETSKFLEDLREFEKNSRKKMNLDLRVV